MEGGREGDQRRTAGGTSARIRAINSSRLGGFFVAGPVRLAGPSRTTVVAQRSESVTVIARFRIAVTVSR
jgi:hypothetical protein